MIIILEEKYSVLEFMSEHVKEMYCDIANLILDSTQNIDEVERMLKDDCYNCYSYTVIESTSNNSAQSYYSGKDVIDLLAQRNILKILNNSKVSELINTFWKGKYDRENFLCQTLCFSVIRNFFMNKRSILGAKRYRGNEHNIVE